MLFLACLTAGTLAGGSIVILGFRDSPPFDVPGTFAFGSLWGQFVGLAAFVCSDKRGELRGRTVHALNAAAWTAGIAATTSWFPALLLLGMMYAAC